MTMMSSHLVNVLGLYGFLDEVLDCFCPVLQASDLPDGISLRSFAFGFSVYLLHIKG